MPKVLLVLLLLCLAPLANAQSYSVIDNRAIKLFQEGELFLSIKKYPEALEKYKAAVARDKRFF